MLDFDTNTRLRSNSLSHLMTENNDNILIYAVMEDF